LIRNIKIGLMAGKGLCLKVNTMQLMTGIRELLLNIVVTVVNLRVMLVKVKTAIILRMVKGLFVGNVFQRRRYKSWTHFGL